MRDNQTRSYPWLAAALPVLALAAMVLTPAPAAADTDFGVRGGLYSDAEAGFVGVELLTDLSRQWFLNPNAEYVFVDEGDLWTLNLDAHYDLPLRSSVADVWLGGGLALVFSDDGRPRGDDSETDVGVNLLAGVGFLPREAVRPYVQGKVLVSDETEAVIAVGLRFF
jgi:hypothetical protein